MGNRTYNILFHTHTVSGIVISVALYVIFFAGSFSFFRDEIVNWERGHTVEDYDELSVDFNSVLKDLKKIMIYTEGTWNWLIISTSARLV